MSAIKTIERTAEVKDLSESYSPILKRYADKRFGHKAHVFPSRLVLEYTIPASALLSIWAECQEDKALQREIIKACGDRHDVKSGFEGEGFTGMAGRDYLGEIRGANSVLRSRLEGAIKELAGSGLKESLQELAMGARKRRRRIFSDCEGSFEFDRRFDDMPFSRMISHKKEFPHIELCFPIGMNCSAEAEEITRFAARCMAIADVLEGAGYRVAITAEMWGFGALGRTATYQNKIAGKKTDADSVFELIRMPVREANDYGDVSSYAPVACGEFFRKAIFAGHLGQNHHAQGMAGDLEKGVDYAFGHYSSARPLPPEAGQLILDEHTVNSLFSLNKETRETMFRDRIQHTIGAQAI